MIMHILGRYWIGAMSTRIVTPYNDTGFGKFLRQQIAQPEDIIRGSPSLFSVTIETMNSDNTAPQSVHFQDHPRSNLLDHGVSTFVKDFEAIGRSICRSTGVLSGFWFI